MTEGKCKCSKCGKEWWGQRQTREKKVRWRSPCCKAKGTDWMKSVWMKDDISKIQQKVM